MPRSSRRRPWGAILVLGAILVPVGPAWAMQSHGGMEGLVGHQIGHLLFIAGLAFILHVSRKPGMVTAGGGRFRLFLWLLLIWNLVTGLGHGMELRVRPEQLLAAGGRTVAFVVRDPGDVLYYLGRLDHLVLVPAMLALFLALRRWRQADQAQP
ncbi:MAG: hypothetical protein AB1634_01390 [Thermodesulfobacteriota bacterium]